MRKIRALTGGAILAGVLMIGAPSVPAQPRPEAGFIPLEENISYIHAGSYFNRIPFRMAPARIWYVFQPADENPSSKPIFVFFNGGPGGATSCGLFAAFTARFAVIRDAAAGHSAIVANPASWTRAGNLLYIDSRTAGFSYSLMDRPEDGARRAGEFDAQNYNPFVDGADFVRVLLKFLAAHPSIRANRIVLVPESYGGIRTNVMLNLLLYYGRYADGSSVYQDPALVDMIRDHYNAVFPSVAGQTVSPAVIAGQFGHQILIQTALTWSYQRRVTVRMLEEPGSPLYQVAAETGIPYVLYKDSPDAVPNPAPAYVLNHIYNWLASVGRDPYHLAMPINFLEGHRTAAEAFLTQIDTLNFMTGVDVRTVSDMYASARANAYKLKAAGSALANRTSAHVPARTEGPPGKNASPFPGKTVRGPKASTQAYARNLQSGFDFSALIGVPPDREKIEAWLSPSGENGMAAVFGILNPWDRYFCDLNYDVANAFVDNKASLLGYSIQHNNSGLYGRMFLENAAWVETFATNAAWDSVVYTQALPEALAMHTDILAAAVYDTEGPPGAARTGQILLAYRPSSVPGSLVSTRTIRFPRYLQSGHAVSVTEPAEFLDDVLEWLAAAGHPSKSH